MSIIVTLCNINSYSDNNPFGTAEDARQQNGLDSGGPAGPNFGNGNGWPGVERRADRGQRGALHGLQGSPQGVAGNDGITQG